MTLTITNRHYFKPYDGSGNSSCWQTDVIAKDIGTLLNGHAIKYEITSDEDGTLISWATPRMQLWISIECIDTNVPSFELEIGAGKRVMFIFARSFPDFVFADEAWMLDLKKLASVAGS
jgi:hypothetical protein